MKVNVRRLIVILITTTCSLTLIGCPNQEEEIATFELRIINSLNIPTFATENTVRIVQLRSAVEDGAVVINADPIASKTVQSFLLSVDEFGDSPSVLINAATAGIIEALFFTQPITANDVVIVHAFGDADGLNGQVEFLTLE